MDVNHGKSVVSR